MGLFSVFNKKYIEKEERLNKKIAELEEVISRKDKEISDLINELDRLNQSTNNVMNNKQLELIEKNIKEAREENSRLKGVIEKYNLSSRKEKYYYKVDVEKFYSASKYKEVVIALTNTGITYIQEMDLETFDNLPKDIKNLEEARIKFQKFIGKDFIEWEIVTYLNKGERLSKFYSKSRKLMNIFNESDMEFMEDIITFDFKRLSECGFKDEQIDEFVSKRDEYYRERRVII